jgi:hypothetical protein
MTIETLPIAALRPFPGNPRKHGEVQLAELERSVRQFGQYRPVVIDESGQILSGHGLVLAMHRAGLSDVQCFRIMGLTDVQKKKLLLADNKVTDLGSTSYADVLIMMRDLSGDYDIPGFDESIVRAMVSGVQEALDRSGTELPRAEAGAAGIDTPMPADRKTGTDVTCPYCAHSFRVDLP